MDIKAYELRHYASIVEWMVKRGLTPPEADEMPKNGYVVYDDETPVSYGSLRLIEGNHALAGDLVTNPECLPQVRSKANDMIILTLIKKAKELKVKTIIAYSQDKNTLLRSEKLGFTRLPHVLIAKSLQETKVKKG